MELWTTELLILYSRWSIMPSPFWTAWHLHLRRFFKLHLQYLRVSAWFVVYPTSSLWFLRVTKLLYMILVLEQVILVAHNTAGTPCTLAMETYPEKIEKAVFLSAVMPISGTVINDYLKAVCTVNSFSSVPLNCKPYTDKMCTNRCFSRFKSRIDIGPHGISFMVLICRGVEDYWSINCDYCNTRMCYCLLLHLRLFHYLCLFSFSSCLS